MKSNKLGRLCRQAKRYGLPFVFWKALGKIGLDPNDNARSVRDKRYLSFTPEERERVLGDWFRDIFGYAMDFSNPKTFDEKIQWLKLYDSTPIKTRLADKYLVREWVKETIGEKYLIPLLGVWDSFDEIDFSKLPEAYVLQCNHGSGMNVIVNGGGNSLDKKKARKAFNRWMGMCYGAGGYELHYKDIPRKIIATKFIQDISDDLPDYKVFCFNGKAKYIHFIRGRFKSIEHAFFDKDWNVQPFTFKGFKKITDLPPKPKRLDEIMRLSEVLSAGFAYVRVDWYLIGDKDIYFGEMTFTPGSGSYKWLPAGTDEYLGSLIELPKERHIIR